MIVVRRALTVPLAVVLTLLLAVTLVVHRANETVLASSFYEDQLAAVGVFDAVHDEVLPRAVDDFLAEQDQQLPDSLHGVALPTDPASRAALLDFARTALPPTVLEDITTDGIDSLVAYLRGERDDLDWAVSLSEPLHSAFLASGAAGDNSTAFERTWTTLDLGNVAIAGLSGATEIPELEAFHDPLSLPVLSRLRADGMPLEEETSLVSSVYEAEAPNAQIRQLTETALGGAASIQQLDGLKTLLVVTQSVEPEPAQQLVNAVSQGASVTDGPLTILLGSERAEATQWLEAELFGAVRELTSYLAGETEHFAIQINFSAYPALAPVVAGVLRSDPDTLLRDGFVLNDIDIQRELDASEDPPFATLDDARALFTSNGRTFGIEDLPAGTADGAAAGAAPSQHPLAQLRQFTSVFASWAVPGATLILVVAGWIGMLGGRRWWSRATWAAAAVAGPALFIAVAAGPLYALVGAPRLETAVADRQAQLLAEDGATTALAVRALDQLEAVIDGQAGAFAINAAAVLLLAIVAAAVAIGWQVRDTRLARATGTPAVEPTRLTIGPPHEATTNDEARAA
ncbi:MAG: hypothetical protein O3A10_02560 [Chloroflexi bacterium]|nr:hypothetical protein [Chloroflexota bacterium]MDA1145213.1 hypothetical protein [Chloroflexota bacterium]